MKSAVGKGVGCAGGGVDWAAITWTSSLIGTAAATPKLTWKKRNAEIKHETSCGKE